MRNTLRDRREVRKGLLGCPGRVQSVTISRCGKIIGVIWETATLAKDDTAIFLAATVEEEYVKVGGRWLVKKVVQTNRFMTPFDEPWTVRRNQPYQS
jgi:hypothetical protein